MTAKEQDIESTRINIIALNGKIARETPDRIPALRVALDDAEARLARLLAVEQVEEQVVEGPRP